MAFNFRLFFRLTFYALFRSKNTHGRLTGPRIRALLGWYLVIPAHNLITWICFFLDDLFFSGYKQQEVKEPVFIIGNFRSGSTLLQRLMAQDVDVFTSMKMWEIYIAPSIIQRKFWLAIGRLDQRFFGKRLWRLADRWDKKRFRSIPMHRVSLWEPDEDEGVMMHNWTSAFLIFIFPFIEALPPHFYFDTEASERELAITMDFYQKIIQRHVYFHQGKRYVAKNPASSVKIEAIRRYFPDAKFIYLVRNPVDMLASKTSFFSYIWNNFGTPLEPYPFREFILKFTKYWYTYPLEKLAQLPESEYIMLKYQDLVEHLEDSVLNTYAHFNIGFEGRFPAVLKEAVKLAEKFTSKHKYSLAALGYTPEQVYSEYREVFERFAFPLDGKALIAQKSTHEAVID